MVGFQIGVAVALLAVGQVDLQLEPELVAQKQAAAKTLDDAMIDRYIAFTREAVKTRPTGEFKTEEARDQADEASAKAAAKKVGLPLEKVGPVSLLVQEWNQVSSPYAGPKGPELKAGFLKRYGQGAVTVLQRNDPKLKKMLQDMVEAEMKRNQGK